MAFCFVLLHAPFALNFIIYFHWYRLSVPSPSPASQHMYAHFQIWKVESRQRQKCDNERKVVRKGIILARAEADTIIGTVAVAAGISIDELTPCHSATTTRQAADC